MTGPVPVPGTVPHQDDTERLNPEASIESLLDLIQSEVYAGLLTLAYDGSYWNVEWVEAHPGDESFQRPAEIDGTYPDLRAALARAATMLGLPRDEIREARS